MNKMNKQWTVNDIKDLKGKVMIVTGGNTGLGYEAAKVFASKNANVILACRSTEKAEKAKNEILKEHPKAHIDIIPLDLSDLKSVSKFVELFLKNYKRLDVLLNNAGIMMVPYQLTKDGFESNQGVNHLGHFALTSQLFPILKSTPQSRIVNVSSSAHKMGKMDFDNYLYEHGKYGKLKAYGRSKLSNLLFTYELDRKIKDKKYDIKVLAAHPGVARTDLGRHMKQGGLLKPIYWIFNKVTLSAYQGALPEIRASLDPNANSGEYYGPVKQKGYGKIPMLVPSNKQSKSLVDAKKLWDISEELTKQKFEV